VSTIERWSGVLARLGAWAAAPAVYDQLVQAYSEPHRAYHSLAHLRDCLGQFDSAAHLAVHPEEVEAALWFHDAVYDPRAADNEARSAEWAHRALLGAGVCAEVVARVVGLVLATCHTAVPADADAALLVDVDLSILGRSWPEFDAYERAVRQEYAWVPEPEFRRARAALLEALLGRPTLYQTPFFHARYERQARANLARSLAQLRQQGDRPASSGEGGASG
jgi:predicted metal-dependent HD superfamily phosphohydrolase